MKAEELSLPGVMLLRTPVHHDDRGFFVELCRASWSDVLGPDVRFMQDNHSRSRQGVLRGLHYQLRHPQGKLVSVVRGAVFDVVADIRVGSPHFGQWLGVRLEAGTGQRLWVPPGYAHGFFVLSDVADVLYKCTDVYHPEDAYGIRWDDPTLGIAWPGTKPTLSDQDAGLPCLDLVGPALPRWA